MTAEDFEVSTGLSIYLLYRLTRAKEVYLKTVSNNIVKKKLSLCRYKKDEKGRYGIWFYNFYTPKGEDIFLFQDYGKTWAVSEEELK